MALCLTIVTGVCAFAQITDDYNKNEFYVGYSNQQADQGNYRNFNGVEGSYVRNVSRYFGIKGDFSAAYRKDSFTFENVFPPNTGTVRATEKSSLYNFLGGIQVKDNASKNRLKPFGHALVGAGHYRSKFETSTNNSGLSNNGFAQTGVAVAVGGGLDIKLNDRFDLRAIQADYNPIRVNGYWNNNFRFGIGIVIK